MLQFPLGKFTKKEEKTAEIYQNICEKGLQLYIVADRLARHYG